MYIPVLDSLILVFILIGCVYIFIAIVDSTIEVMNNGCCCCCCCLYLFSYPVSSSDLSHREPHKNRRGIEEGVRWRGESSHPRVNAPCSLNPEGTQQGASESSQSSVTVRTLDVAEIQEIIQGKKLKREL